MTVAIRVREETFGGGGPACEITLELPEERVTARRLIEEHVRRRLAEAEAHAGGEVGGGRGTAGRAEAVEVEKALDAFRRGRFLVLVGDEQVDDLDREVAVTWATAVRFVRLVPLAGG